MSGYVAIYETGDDGSVSAYLPEPPTILVSGRDPKEACGTALQGIHLDVEEMDRVGERIPAPSMCHEALSV